MEEKDYIIKVTQVDAETMNISFFGNAQSIYEALSCIVTSMIEDIKMSPDSIANVLDTTLAKYKTTEGSEEK